MVSGRFKGDWREQVLRELVARLRELTSDESILAVEADSNDFGPDTRRALYEMMYMVAVMYGDYGQKTGSKCCSYYELESASNKGRLIIPLKMFETTKDSPW